jgi:hypothetical protein
LVDYITDKASPMSTAILVYQSGLNNYNPANFGCQQQVKQTTKLPGL